MIKAVLFDMDGILYDSEACYMSGTVQLMQSLGYQGKVEEIYRIIGTTMDETYSILSHLVDGRYSKDQIMEMNETYFKVTNPIRFKEIMFPGVPEALKMLKSSGIKLACCSSSPEKVIRDSLTELEILEYFDFIQSGESIQHPKPAPDTYLNAANALSVNIDECVVYEDSNAGIRAGKSAGIFTIAREDNRFYQDQSSADLMVKTIQELVQYVLDGGAVCEK